jgi:hypothetical protein
MTQEKIPEWQKLKSVPTSKSTDKMEPELGYDSVREHLPGIHKAPSLIPRTGESKQKCQNSSKMLMEKK